MYYTGLPEEVVDAAAERVDIGPCGIPEHPPGQLNATVRHLHAELAAAPTTIGGTHNNTGLNSVAPPGRSPTTRRAWVHLEKPLTGLGTPFHQFRSGHRRDARLRAAVVALPEEIHGCFRRWRRSLLSG